MNRNEPVHTLRELHPYSAKDAARRRYLIEYERLCEAEQMHKLLGNDDDAEYAHWGAVRALRAWDAELDDREPAR